MGTSAPITKVTTVPKRTGNPFVLPIPEPEPAPARAPEKELAPATR